MTPEVRADIDRIERAVGGVAAALRRGRPVPVRAFCAADAMYAPVVMRFQTYAPRLAPETRALLRGGARGARRARLGGRGGCARQEFVAEDEPYATPPGARDEDLRRSAARCATSCSACRCRTATTWWWARRRSEMAARWASAGGRATSRCSCIPQTHEEYALARTERKTAPGYKGFAFHAAPDVTLEEDLRAPRPHHQRDGARRRRHADRSARRRARPAAPACCAT